MSTKTFLLLDYCGGAKRIYAGNDREAANRAQRFYQRTGWTVHRFRAKSFKDATAQLERKVNRNV